MRRVRPVNFETPVIRKMREEGLCVAILHSGGPAPGGNRVLAGAAKQFLDLGLPVIGFKRGFAYLEKVDPRKFRSGTHFIPLTEKRVRLAIDTNALIIKTSRANPGKLIERSGDLKDPEKTQGIDNLLDVFEKLRVGALITIGGDDTLNAANSILAVARRRMKENPGFNFLGIVHVPKTIDNDYFGIQWTFGFFTAAERIAEKVRGLYDDAKATDSYHILEAMGRKAGWLVLVAGAKGRATKTIIPEDFPGKIDIEKLADELITVVLKREKKRKGYGVFCVAEGLADRLPEEVKKGLGKDLYGNARLADARIGETLAAFLSQKYKERTGRSKKFLAHTEGYSTRQAPPNLYDSILTSVLGIGAARLVMRGRFGEMVTVADNFDLYGVSFNQLLGERTLKVRNKFVNPQGDLYLMVHDLEEYFPT